MYVFCGRLRVQSLRRLGAGHAAGADVLGLNVVCIYIYIYREREREYSICQCIYIYIYIHRISSVYIHRKLSVYILITTAAPTYSAWLRL